MYYRQLDGLRAIAVIMVIFHHWIFKSSPLAPFAHFGAHGVDLFFVLSGFLITSILLNQKQKLDFDIKKGVKLFYIRRVIRIFPIYYLTIGLICIFVLTEIKPHLIWLLTYQYNNHVFFADWQAPPYIHHLWTLSIEEQFYLIWPFLIFFFSNKVSFRLAFGIMFISIFAKTVLYKTVAPMPFEQFTLSSFAGLSLGTVLAYLRFWKISIPYRRELFIFLLILFVYLSSPYLHFTGKSLLKVLIPLPALLSFLVIDKSLDQFDGYTGRFLENAYVVWVGRISYGLYLYHMFIPYITSNYTEDNNWVMYTLVNSIFLLVAASLSWYLVEKPINALKVKFSY